jgi:hypothetical protein
MACAGIANWFAELDREANHQFKKLGRSPTTVKLNGLSNQTRDLYDSAIMPQSPRIPPNSLTNVPSL